MPGRVVPERIRYETVSFRAMNTSVSALFDIHGAEWDADEACGQLFKMFTDAERRMSRFLEDSELSRWNRSKAEAAVLSPMLYDCVRTAWDVHVRTKGLITPFVLEALEAAGYDRSFEKMTSACVGREKKALCFPFWRKARLEFDVDRRAVGREPADLRLDLGGFAKGWTVAATARLLRDCGRIRRGLIDAGGDIVVWGGERELPWRVEVVDPFEEGRSIAELILTEGAVATSSSLGRRWICFDGTVAHHLIDPRTMRPAESDVVQCTAVGDELVECEAAAKLVCLLGSRDGPAASMKIFPDISLLLVTASGSIRVVSKEKEDDGDDGS